MANPDPPRPSDPFDKYANRDILLQYYNQLNSQLALIHPDLFLRKEIFLQLLRRAYEYCPSLDFHERLYLCVMLENLLERNKALFLYYNTRRLYGTWWPCTKSSHTLRGFSIKIAVILALFQKHSVTWLDWLLVPTPLGYYFDTIRGVPANVDLTDEINVFRRLTQESGYSVVL